MVCKATEVGRALRRCADGRLRTGHVANGQPTWRSSDEGKVCLLDEYQVEVGVWIIPHSIIRAGGEGGSSGRVVCVGT